ncbi:hypothetical protein CRG98_007836 [Punica granatum]|uniref:Uncharacterized protein n=1 Tax=Punica granatum TaxID=22663 RepID=A0A2I0KTY4_PUNGR|nr:hypothetical protein CRG98_007836 [Punica granatum]
MGPIREKRMDGGCARLIGPRIVTTNSRGRARVVRNPWNVMARLAEVVGRSGTSEGSMCAARGISRPECSHGWNEAREFGNFWLESGWVVTGIPGGFPMILAGFGLGLGPTNEWEWAGV